MGNSAIELSRRQLLCGATAAAVMSSGPAEAQPRAVTPEQFGAVGDGRTNDTDAFVAMAAFVSAQGGGEIRLRRATYIVGKQGPGGLQGYAFAPSKIMQFEGCKRPLIIRGNGARLRCASGLRYGTFDPVSSKPTKHKMPYFGSGELSAPYFAMIWAENCTAGVEISDIELDGNLQQLEIGGPFGDADWQIGCAGIRLVNNLGDERLSRIRCHHHAQDGITIDGSPARNGSGVLEEVVCDSNVRQGCSLVGGRNYDFRKCEFKNTGKAGLASLPGAGLDIEAEGKTIRDLKLSDCLFANNIGPGMVADSGNTEGALFERCRFIGTTSWAAWPRMPRFRFSNCEFVGSIVHAHGDPDPNRAAQFHDCTFRDDPALSPTGEVYNAAEWHPIAELPHSPNVLFNRCRFILTHRAVLPWTTNVVIFSNCTMSQKAEKTAYPRGTYVGRNRIDAKVDLYSSKIKGELILNGRLIPPGS